MRYLKLSLVFLFHLACTVLVQYLLFRLLMGNGSGLRNALLCLVPAALVCVADLILSCLLLKGIRLHRIPFILLQFWDFLLIFPALILAIVGILSGEEGIPFAVAALILDLLLIFERSTGFVLFDPLRTASE